MTEPGSPQFDDAAGLVQAGAGEAVLEDPPGSVRAAVANAMVGMKAKFYGRGPDKAKAYFNDDYLFVVMEGGLTRNEETLLADGKESLVRQYRLEFEDTMDTTVKAAVEELVGRVVLDYHSQIVFSPPRVFEIFVLGDKLS
jgi:uncharacterized protein YbcI